MMRIPPTYSLASMNGPSVSSSSSPRGRTTVAVSGASRPPENTQAPASRISRWSVSTFFMIVSSSSAAGGVPSVGVTTLSR
jgi:hypothetical protein